MWGPSHQVTCPLATAIPSACLAEATLSALHLAIHGAGAQILIVLGGTGERKGRRDASRFLGMCYHLVI